MKEIKPTEDGFDKKNERGMRRELIAILLTCGVVSLRGLHSFEEEHEVRMYSRTLKKLENERIIDEAKCDRKKLFRLNEVNRRANVYTLDAFELENYWKYGAMYAEASGRYVSTPQKCKRAMLNSETVMMMYGAGINALLDEKPALFKNEMIPEKGAYYYQSLEIKDITGYEAQIKEEKEKKTAYNTRAVGILAAAADEYIVYNIDQNVIKWSEISEKGFSFNAGLLLNTIKENRKEKSNVKSCIILYRKDTVLKKAFDYTDAKKKLYVSAETGFKETLYVPYTKEGRKLLRIITTEGWRDKLREKYLKEYDLNTSNLSVVCDGVRDSDGRREYALLYCIPDMTKLYRFLKTAQWYKDSAEFKIYCYSYQTDFLKKVTQGSAEIYETEINEDVLYP